MATATHQGKTEEGRAASLNTAEATKKPRRWIKVVLIAGIVVAAICLIGVVALYFFGINTAKNMNWIRSSAWSPDRSYIAVGGGNNIITVWDTTSGKVLTTISKHKSCVRSLAWTPDGKTLASGGGDGSVFLWDPLTGQLVEQLENAASGLGYLDWSPDGSMLAYVGEANTIMLWNAVSRTKTVFARVKGDVTGVSWSRDGTRIAVCDTNGDVTVLDVRTGQAIWSVHAHQGWANGIHWAPDGKRLASGGDDYLVQIWDAETGKQLEQMKSEVQIWSVVWSPGLPPRLAWQSKITEVTISDFKGAGLPLSAGDGLVYILKWSPDGEQLAGGTEHGTVYIWDVSSGREVQMLVVK